jgi:hypothetical protein
MKNIQYKNLSFSYRKIIFLFLLCWPGSFCVNSQDRIHKSDSSIIEAKVMEISEDLVKYKKFSNLSGPLYTINKAEVNMIVYENGEKEQFKTGNQEEVKMEEYTEKEPLKCIEDLWGVKLEDAMEKGGGVKIVKLEANSIFMPQTPTNRLYFFAVNNGGKPVRVKNTTEFTTVVFDSYNQGISKINLTSGSRHGGALSYSTWDPIAIDISGLSKCLAEEISLNKLSAEESNKAGQIVSGIYHKGSTNWGIQGFTIGLCTGVPSIALMSAAAVLPPRTPVTPQNVDSEAWLNGYKSKLRSKRLVSGIIGSIAGTILVVGAFSSAN